MGDTRALLWSLPVSFYDQAAVAATHGSGFAPRSSDLPDSQPGGAARDDADGEPAAGRTDAWKESGFATLEEWRAHTHTDLFRFNAKRRAAGRPALTEAEFERLAQAGEVSSISGDSSSSDDDSDGPQQQQRRQQRRAARASLQPSLGAKVVFADTSGGLFAVWRAALASPREEKEDTAWGCGSLLSAPARLRALRASPGAWVVMLARGGHFAALVVRMSQAPEPKHVIAHRTFHRYVVRAKQGGRQGTKDATGKSIKSAGSALRRANEQALERDIRGLLTGEWRQHVSSADLIWLAVSDTDRRILLGTGASGDSSAPLHRDDPRLRRVPFGTRRPTLQEAQRVASLLATVDLGITPAEESDGDEPGERPGHGRAQAEHPRVAPGAAGSGGETPLHVASRAGDVATLVQLLAGGADPCARDGRGRPAAQVARNRATHHAFQRARAAAPDAWDWDAAGVGPPLTPAMEAADAERRAAADAVRRQAARERQAKREGELAQAQAAAQQREARDAAALEDALKGARSSAAALLGAAADAQRQAREARAAAAEKRLAGLGVGGGGPRGGGGPPGPDHPPPQPPAASAAAAQNTAVQPAAARLGADLAEAAVRQLAQGMSPAQAAVLARLLANVAGQPGEAKYRRLRLSNPKVSDAVVATGALASLLVPCLGWTLEPDDDDTPDAVAAISEEQAGKHADAMLACVQLLQKVPL